MPYHHSCLHCAAAALTNISTMLKGEGEAREEDINLKENNYIIYFDGFTFPSIGFIEVCRIKINACMQNPDNN